MTNDIDEDYLARMFRLAGERSSPSADHHARLRERVLDVFDDAVESNRTTWLSRHTHRIWRAVMGHPAARYAASAAVLAAVLTTLWMLLGSTPQIAFADLIQPILDAKTAEFTMTTRSKDHGPVTVKVMTSGTRVRTEGPNGTIQVMDFSTGRSLDILPMYKVATLAEMKNFPKDKIPASYLDQFRMMLRQAEEDPELRLQELGKKSIDGQRALGYRVAASIDESYTLWIAPETRTLVRVDVTSSYQSGYSKTMSGFRFGVDFDDSLFSLEPPEGYEVRRVSLDLSPIVESDFIAALKWACDALDGRFPDALTNDEYHRIQSVSASKRQPGSNDQDLDAQLRLGRSFSFPFSLPLSANPHYAGRGVRRGEKDRPIFWYKPADSDFYRIVDADLTVREAAQAPVVPGAESIAPSETEQ